MPSIKLICLANSYKSYNSNAISKKRDGRCIAGIDLESGYWVRPISLDNGALSPQECSSYFHDEQIHPLDIFTFSYTQRKPSNHHPEDYINNPQVIWLKHEHYNEKYLSALLGAVSQDAELIHGNTNKIDSRLITDQSPIRQSLQLICPDNPILYVTDYQGKRKYRSKFSYRGIGYDLPITDDNLTKNYELIKSGSHIPLSAPSREKLYYTISLSEEFKGFYYKLIASIIYF